VRNSVLATSDREEMSDVPEKFVGRRCPRCLGAMHVANGLSIKSAISEHRTIWRSCSYRIAFQISKQNR
jgi:hypothetical protein